MALSNTIADLNLTEVENRLAASHNQAQTPYERSGKFLFVPGAGFIDSVFQRNPATGHNQFALNHWDIGCTKIIDSAVVTEGDSDVTDLQLFVNGADSYVTIVYNQRDNNGNYNAHIKTLGPVNR